jgi:putative phage-type endonuclease
MKYHNVEQNSDEWYNLRKGKFTASTFKDLFMGKSTAGYEKAINTVTFERLTGESPESFTNDYMQRGHELEPFAIEAYEMETFNVVQNGGFFEYNEWVGASPDGLINNDGILEIKSPAYNTFIKYLKTQKLPKIYHWQVYGQLMVTGREWCDFIAYHPKFKPLIIRINRDEKIIDELQNKLNENIEIVKKDLLNLKKYKLCT